MVKQDPAAADGPAEADRETLRRLFAELQAPRSALRSFFDGWVRERGDAALPVNFLHAIARARRTATGYDPVKDGDALALAVSALGPRQTALEWVTAAVSHGLFDTSMPGTDSHTTRAHLTDLARYHLNTGLDFGIARFHKGSFQVSRSLNQTWSDPGHVAPAMMLARRRLCRIVVCDLNEETTTGTGFLVGPSVVLTNYHVVKGLITPGLNGPLPPLDEPWRIRLEFDYSSTTGQKENAASHFGPKPDWCVARSPEGILAPDGAQGNWWTDPHQRNGWLGTIGGHLDYALIRVDGAPGLQRGWYDLQELSGSGLRDGCWVMHHPTGLDQTITEGRLYFFNANAARPRIFHSASTVDGSSGGLLLNSRGAAMALHHAGLGVDVFGDRQPGQPDPVEGKTFINIAVPLSRIYDDLKVQGATTELRETISIAPYRGTLGDNIPVFGREPFFRDLEELHRGDRRILMVHVAPELESFGKPGKSFSGDIIRSIFSGDDHHHVTLGPKERKVDARPMAEAMLMQLDPDRIAQLATAADTTGPAFVKALSAVIEATVRSPRYANRLVWIVLDDLERAHVADGSGRELLATLYSSSRTLVNLRIVLIGLPHDTQIGGIPTDAPIRSVIGPQDVGDLKGLFRRWIALQGERNRHIDPGALDILGAALASYASTGAPLSLMSGFVANHLSAAVAAFMSGTTEP